MQTAAEIAEKLAPEAFERLPTGKGSKGERLYDWALTSLRRLQLTDEERAWSHALLIRRSTSGPRREGLLRRLRAPRGGRAGNGRPWRIEEGFEQAKEVCGFDEYEVCKYEVWHRHITLSVLAHAFLAAAAAREQKKGTQQAT